ncbi:hypothetical protein FA15DRAFT_760838 [Coprinopsis marcescibilis]|uniref:DUF6533 domain-containing protein n=1 Tax=Coprinopsis marcescibilis TaxID=230819 RepID=A0A5C3KDC6_COPMA|nr:hypothetical protein FA15DRAFT_760838 [Coprinopsis marcescibilis]
MSNIPSCAPPLTQKSLPKCTSDTSLKRLEFSLQFASLAILYFDYLLTLGDEIKYIWLRKWKMSTLFYFFCRYALVANVLYMLAISEDITGVNCNTGYIICGVLSILGHIGIIAVWTLRTCAVYNNNKYLLAFFTACGASVIILLIYRAPFIRCKGARDMSAVLGANGAIMLFIEIFSFLLAGWKALKMIQESKRANAVKTADDAQNQQKRTLYDIILSQGIWYIFAVSAISAAQMILNFTYKTGFISRLLNGLKLPLSGFLTARFVLKLRAYRPMDPRPNAAHTTTGTGTIPPLQFQRASMLNEWAGDIKNGRRNSADSMFDDDHSSGPSGMRMEKIQLSDKGTVTDTLHSNSTSTKRRRKHADEEFKIGDTLDLKAKAKGSDDALDISHIRTIGSGFNSDISSPSPMDFADADNLKHRRKT